MRDARLPLVTFYLTERCNSRCVTCDYWRHGRKDATLESVLRVLPDLRTLGTRVALLSGGEPLLNPEWLQIARRCVTPGFELWLLTSGLSLAKHARRAGRSSTRSRFRSTARTRPPTRRFAGSTPSTRFAKACARPSRSAPPCRLRVTLQRANYRELPRFVTLARELGVRQVSFLAVDVGNAHAFARTGRSTTGSRCASEDLPRFDALIDVAGARTCGRISQTDSSRSRPPSCGACTILRGAVRAGRLSARRCNAPEFSAVIGVDGRVRHVFSSRARGVDTRAGLAAALER